MLKWITSFTRQIEKQASGGGFVYNLACQYYQDIIRKEAILANITAQDHILCIGGGICPFSAILFHQLTGAKVTVIDNNSACIPEAQQVIDRLKIGKDVRVFCQDGNSADLPWADYTVIHLALQVSPLDSVLKQVTKYALPGTRLLVRRPKKQLATMYCRLVDNLLNCCPYTTHKARNIGSTLLYTKQARAGAMA